MMEDKAYSVNGESYYDLDSVMSDLRGDYQVGQEVEIYEGDSVRPTHAEFFKPNWFIDSMRDSAYDNYGEWSDGYLDDLDAEKEEELGKVIVDWLEKNAKAPAFFTVKNVKTIKVTVDE